MSRMQSIIKQGYAAAQGGLPISACPYSPVADRFRSSQWRRGWRQGRHEQRDEPQDAEQPPRLRFKTDHDSDLA